MLCDKCGVLQIKFELTRNQGFKRQSTKIYIQAKKGSSSKNLDSGTSSISSVKFNLHGDLSIDVWTLFYELDNFFEFF